MLQRERESSAACEYSVRERERDVSFFEVACVTLGKKRELVF